MSRCLDGGTLDELYHIIKPLAPYPVLAIAVYSIWLSWWHKCGLDSLAPLTQPRSVIGPVIPNLV